MFFDPQIGHIVAKTDVTVFRADLAEAYCLHGDKAIQGRILRAMRQSPPNRLRVKAVLADDFSQNIGHNACSATIPDPMDRGLRNGSQITAAFLSPSPHDRERTLES